jgi:hypothetical protein
VQAVRLSCTVLSDQSLTDEAIRKAALTQAYPRIALILAGSVDKEGKGIIPQGSISYEVLYREVERIVTSHPYVDDIHRVATALTASYFIRATPLNSSIQLLPLGNRLEEQAIEDLDRLRGQALYQLKALLNPINTAVAEGPTFYFSGLVEEGRSSDTLTFSEGTKGIAVITIYHQSQPMEVVVDVLGTIPDMIEELSRAINQLSMRMGSNILASPNRGTHYVIGTDRIEGGALIRIDSITLSSRKYDPYINRELLLLSFYLVPSATGDRSSIIREGIPSLLYGVVPDYSQLNARGPHSILLQVEKGAVEEVPRPSNVDTIYIQGEGYGDIPYSISVGAEVLDGYIPIVQGGDIARQVSEYLRGLLGSKALVVQLNPSAVQIIPSSLPVSVSIGNSLPPGISTSTGTAQGPIYPYGGNAVTVSTISPTNNIPQRRPTLAEEASGVYSATNFRMGISPTMQSVYDKLHRLQELRRGYGRCK